MHKTAMDGELRETNLQRVLWDLRWDLIALLHISPKKMRSLMGEAWVDAYGGLS